MKNLIATTVLCGLLGSAVAKPEWERELGAHSVGVVQKCFDDPSVKNSCGSHCWPNCETHQGGSVHPTAFDYNHYMILPESTTCYIDTNDYGRFDMYLSPNSNVKITYDTYEYTNGVCQSKSSGVNMPPGALRGDPYCQIYVLLDMHSCGGCSASTRRIEVYTNSDKGCGGEFYTPPNPVTPVVPPTPKPVDPTPVPTPAEPVAPGPTSPEEEPSGAKVMGLATALMSISLALY